MATSTVPKKTAQTPAYLKPLHPLSKVSIPRLWMSAPTSCLLQRSGDFRHVGLVDIEQDPHDVDGLGEIERANWPNVFPADDVFHYFDRLYKLQLNREGHQLTAAELLNSFASFLCSQGLTNRGAESQPHISDWLQDEFTDAVLIWERVYFKHYARIRWNLDLQRPGVWNAWLEYLEIGLPEGRLFNNLSTYDKTEVKPVFSVAEYMAHAERHWSS
ncbi:hypothetical protein JCM11641_006658 [Rhodosporidiobolus odoratus]